MARDLKPDIVSEVHAWNGESLKLGVEMRMEGKWWVWKNPGWREVFEGLGDRVRQIKKEAEMFSRFKTDSQGEW